MEKHTQTTWSIYEPFPWLVMRSREEAVEELGRSCGRFKSPDELEDRLRLFVAERMRGNDPLGEGQLFAGSGVPLNWRGLAAYLHEHGVVEKPNFFYESTRNDRPKIPNFGLTLNKTARKTDGRSEVGAAFGANLSAEDALSKTIGETLERYFLSIYERAAMQYGSFASLSSRGRSVLDITRLNTFLPFQKKAFPEFVSNVDTPFYWVMGEQYPRGKRALLPAQLVFWNYRHDASPEGKKEAVLARPTTSACAGHFSKEEAVLAGLLEHIQRDGFLIFWLNHISPPLLNVPLLNDPDVTGLVEYAKRYRLEMKFVNTTSDIRVPSVTCVVTDAASPEGPVISLGSATGFDVKDLFLHSALEALAVNNYADAHPTYIFPETYTPFLDERIGREQRLTAWKGPRMAERFAFFVSGKLQDPRELFALSEGRQSPSEQLKHVEHEFERLGEGYEIFVYEVRDAVLDALGYHVVRTLVPQLMALHLNEYAATLDSKRVREVPEKLGYKPSSQMNPWPHPFP